MSDSDVFIISAISNLGPAKAISQAVQSAGTDSVRVQDVIFGLDKPRSFNIEKIISNSGLKCSTATVSSSLRAAFFAAQSILSLDADVVIVVGVEANASTAILLASPDAVGRWNLMPRARLAARSLSGVEFGIANSRTYIQRSDTEQRWKIRRVAYKRIVG